MPDVLWTEDDIIDLEIIKEGIKRYLGARGVKTSLISDENLASYACRFFGLQASDDLVEIFNAIDKAGLKGRRKLTRNAKRMAAQSLARRRLGVSK